MKLDDHIQQLPQHTASMDLWEKIDQKIISQEASLTDRLPHHQASEDLWFKIDATLNKKSIRRRFIISRFSVAASLALIVTMGTLFLKEEPSQYVYSTEEVYEESSIWTTVNSVDVLDNCSDQPSICSTPTFTRLKNALDQLKMEEQKLRLIKSNTNDPKLDVYHARIVRDIQKVESELLAMFI